jgi:hypothetical protein
MNLNNLVRLDVEDTINTNNNNNNNRPSNKLNQYKNQPLSLLLLFLRTLLPSPLQILPLVLILVRILPDLLLVCPSLLKHHQQLV